MPEYVCGGKRSRNRGLCQKVVTKEGDRCPDHPVEGKENTVSRAGKPEEVVVDVDASSVDELAKKLGLGLDAMKKLERSLRDPDQQDEGDDIYLSMTEQNIIRLQLRADANPQNTGLLVTIGNMIGQYKMNQKRHLEAQKVRLELVKLQREIALIDTANADVLSYMEMVNRGLSDGFFGMDPSPRRSFEAYCDWLGENITVEQVLAGEHERATQPWEMQETILRCLFWPETLRWTAGEKDASGELIYYTGKPDLRYTICVTGNTMGKSYISARCILFQSLFLYPSITIVTGPRLSQVRDTVSAELRRKHTEMSLPGKPSVLRYQPNQDNDRAYVNFTSAQSDDAFAGHHGRILIIMEEASGVAAHIYESSHGLMSGEDCKMLQIGNMHRRQGRFYEYYDKALKNPKDPQVHLIQRGAFDHPNYIHRDFIRARGGKDIYQHGVNADWVDESIERWGAESHRTYIRIYGLPPKQDTNSMISLYLVESAVEHEYMEDEATGDMFDVAFEVIFADIAGLGDNLTVIGAWQWGRTGHRVLIKRVLSISDHSDIADAMIDCATRPINDHLYFSCDTNGEGSGILEMLIERNVDEWNTRGFKSFSSPEEEKRHGQSEEYDDLETECWARLRKWLRRSDRSIVREGKGDQRIRIDFPPDSDPYSAQLVRELSERDHFITNDNRVKLQPKKEFIKIIGDSPDFAEAVVIGSRMVWIAQEEFDAKIDDEEYKAHVKDFPVV